MISSLSFVEENKDGDLSSHSLFSADQKSGRSGFVASNDSGRPQALMQKIAH